MKLEHKRNLKDAFTINDFGNINFGYAARIFGIDLADAKLGAGLNQIRKGTGDLTIPRGFFDRDEDTPMIEFGYFYTAPWPSVTANK